MISPSRNSLLNLTPRRNGSVYLVVLCASLIVGSLALAAMSTAHLTLSAEVAKADTSRCQLAAQAALEWAVASIAEEPNWRVSHTHNVDVTARRLSGVEVTYRLLDTVDGDLANDANQNCQILATARIGNSQATYQATLRPAGPPLNCLSHSVAVGQNIELGSLAAWSTEHQMACGQSLSIDSNAMLVSDVLVGGTTTGSVVGNSATLSDSLSIPGSDIFEAYAGNAVRVDSSLLTLVDTTLTLENHLLSATTNTLTGDPSSTGIYVLDCGGNDLLIENCRFLCTLVVRNVGSRVRIGPGVCWEAHTTNYPAILVDGTLDLASVRGWLDESTIGVNLNPAGSPYRGAEDTSTSTIYPNQIRGIVYASSGITMSSTFAENEIHGCLITPESLTGRGDLVVHYSTLFQESPPPGFQSSSNMTIVAGTVARAESL